MQTRHITNGCGRFFLRWWKALGAATIIAAIITALATMSSASNSDDDENAANKFQASGENSKQFQAGHIDYHEASNTVAGAPSPLSQQSPRIPIHLDRPQRVVKRARVSVRFESSNRQTVDFDLSLATNTDRLFAWRPDIKNILDPITWEASTYALNSGWSPVEFTEYERNGRNGLLATRSITLSNEYQVGFRFHRKSSLNASCGQLSLAIAGWVDGTITFNIHRPRADARPKLEFSYACTDGFTRHSRTDGQIVDTFSMSGASWSPRITVYWRQLESEGHRPGSGTAGAKSESDLDAMPEATECASAYAEEPRRRRILRLPFSHFVGRKINAVASAINGSQIRAA